MGSGEVGHEMGELGQRRGSWAHLGTVMTAIYACAGGEVVEVGHKSREAPVYAYERGEKEREK